MDYPILIILLIFCAIIIYYLHNRYIYLDITANFTEGAAEHRYYHGSSTLIKDYLLPHPSAVINGENAVFATNTHWLALVFIPRHTDADLDIGFADGIPYIAEKYAGAFKLLKASGYIYEVSTREFHSDPRLGMQHHEFINPQKVRILHQKFVPDIFGALKKTEVNFIPFAKWPAFKKKHDIPD